jgi:hypothetical protein
VKETVSKFKTMILMAHGLLPAIVGWIVEKMLFDTSNTLVGFAVFAVIWVVLFTATKPFFYKLANKY